MGFFDLDKIVTDLPQHKKQQAKPGEPICSKCQLFSKGCLSPKMQPTGQGKEKILVVAEAPGAEEDQKGVQLVGKVGRYFRSILVELGYSLDRDFIKINAVNCRPPKNRKPTSKEIEYCRPMILKTIEDFKPKLILLMGEAAVQSVLGVEWKKDITPISKWVGFVIPDRYYNAWIAPLYHPSFIIRNKDYMPVYELQFKKDLERALKFKNLPLPKFKDESECSTILWDESEIKSKLNDVLSLAERSKRRILFAFDYETTGLKPHATGHKIYTVSFSYEFDQAYSFWLDGCSDETHDLWQQIMLHPKIYKVAHNLKYEDTWTYHILGYRPRPWYWDTMLNAHILDNRPYITGLKFQSFIHFGIAGYDDDVSKFLDAKGSNAINTVDKAPKGKILLYNAIDSLVAFRLLLYQMAMFDVSPKRFYNADEMENFKPYLIEEGNYASSLFESSNG